MYKAIDLFAGIGGIRLGFKLAFKEDIKFVFSSEIDKFARKTYACNFNSEPSGDITKISAEDVPKHDILCAGFPCQAFSITGKRKGFEDTRGTLFFDIVRIAEYHKPSVIFLENVKGLLSNDKGNTFNVIIDTLESLGYVVYYKVINSKNFGVPQKRERIYFVCFRDCNILFTFPDANIKSKVGDILEDLTEEKYTITDIAWKGCIERKKRNRKAGNFGYSLFYKDSAFTKTITARYSGAEALIHQDDKNPRKLTPREVARLQSFPDRFILPCSDTQTYKQLGNSVTVNVVKEIALQIKNVLGKK